MKKALVAEFIGTFTLIFAGVGAIAHLGGGDKSAALVGIAMAHGLAIAVMVSALGSISGGHFNPAVTFGLLIGGKIKPCQTAAYWAAQLAGAAVAAYLMGCILGTPAVSGGTPDLGKGVTMGTGILIEAVMTFFLVLVVYGTAVDGRAPKVGGLFIGITILVDILLGGPVSGAAMNPARAFGPALASGHWANHMVYWVGPLIGGGLAGLIYGRFLIQPDA